MDWWRILVLATLKQGLNSDYDRLAELANEHGTLRKMLGHGTMPHDYNRQTVADNVRLLTPQLLDEISRLVVCEGHQAAGKKPEAALHGRADSFCTDFDELHPIDSGVNITNLYPPTLEIRLLSNAEDPEFDDLMERHHRSQNSNPASVLESVSIRNKIRQIPFEICSVYLSSVRKYLL